MKEVSRFKLKENMSYENIQKVHDQIPKAFQKDQIKLWYGHGGRPYQERDRRPVRRGWVYQRQPGVNLRTSWSQGGRREWIWKVIQVYKLNLICFGVNLNFLLWSFGFCGFLLWRRFGFQLGFLLRRRHQMISSLEKVFCLCQSPRLLWSLWVLELPFFHFILCALVLLSSQVFLRSCQISWVVNLVPCWHLLLNRLTMVSLVS